jgi:hypothetical protein
MRGLRNVIFMVDITKTIMNSAPLTERIEIDETRNIFVSQYLRALCGKQRVGLSSGVLIYPQLASFFSVYTSADTTDHAVVANLRYGGNSFTQPQNNVY